jgi:hypothetical protein
VTATVFLGLITHRGSRFQDSSDPDGLVTKLAGELRRFDLRTVVQINDQDSYTPDLLTLDRNEVRRSITAELAVEQEWRRFLDPDASRAGLATFMLARRAYRIARFAPPWKRALRSDDPGVRMLRRLVNIELSHVALMHEAVECGSDWAVIAEDDASSEDVPRLAEDLSCFVADRASHPQPKYVNISESFGHARLGTESHLRHVGSWGTGTGPTIEILSAGRPVTNTVCAILYRTTFLTELVTRMDEIPISPVLPIDWKLNRALLTMFEAGQIGDGDCWTVSPAPLLQRSMHFGSNGHRSSVEPH